MTFCDCVLKRVFQAFSHATPLCNHSLGASELFFLLSYHGFITVGKNAKQTKEVAEASRVTLRVQCLPVNTFMTRIITIRLNYWFRFTLGVI